MMVGPMRSLRRDDAVRSLVRNASRLLSAQVLTALIGIVTLAVAARSLGPAGLGAFAMVEAYVRVIDLFCRPEPWQAVIAYGARPLEQDDHARLGRLFRFGIAVDLFGALAATAIAVALAVFAGPLVGVADGAVGLAAAASLMLAASVSSTPVAILRLHDRFGALAALQVWVAVGRLALTVAAALAGGGVAAFVAVMAATHVAEHLGAGYLAYRELSRRGRLADLAAPMRGVVGENPGILRFIATSNVTVAARQSTQRLDSLLIGALSGAAEVGLYQIAKRVGLAALKFGRPLQQAIYPELARLRAKREFPRFRRLAFGVAGGLGVTGLVAVAIVAPFMEQLVVVAFGEAFAAAAPIMIVQALAVAVFLSGVGIAPALLALGRSGALALLTSGGAVAFFAALAVLAPGLGAMAGSGAHLALNLVIVVGATAILLRSPVGPGPGDADSAAGAPSGDPAGRIDA